MIFVGKYSKSILYAVIALTLVICPYFMGIAGAGEISGGSDLPGGDKSDLADAEETLIDEGAGYSLQNVYFTEDEQRYVVVYPNGTYVSLARNEKAGHKSQDAVCQFL